MNKAFLKADSITKIFGDVVANDNVNFQVAYGETHALLGENGAGKSTLMNMISGIYLADSGQIYIDGVKVNISSPKVAMSLGVGMIHQHFKLVEVMTGLENIMLGEKSFFLRKKKKYKDIMALMEKYDFHIDLNMPVRDMSMGQKQILEIMMVLDKGAKILILDEPTTVLTPQEIGKLFEIIKNMNDKGHSIIFISHKLDEVMDISDKVTILRKGKSIATVTTKDTSPSELTELMVGKPIELKIDRIETKKGEKLLEFENVVVLNQYGSKSIDNISFSLHKGEILGVAGINGHGQKDICEAITGINKIKQGSIKFKGERIENKSVRDIEDMGARIGFVPEDRLGMGLVSSMSISENCLLKLYQSQGFVINRESSKQIASNIVDELDVKTSGENDAVRLMSGGNIQKVLIGRELKLNPELLITAYPVRGLDINTTHKIFDLINQQKKSGVGVLYISEDLDSLLALCDRIMVLHHGHITGLVEASTTTKEEIGLMMLGKNEVSR